MSYNRSKNGEYNRDEVRTPVGVYKLDQEGKNSIHVDKIVDNEDGGIVKMDVRKWYTTKEGDVKPSTQGIRIKKSDLPEIVALLVSQFDTDEMFDFESACNEKNVPITFEPSDETQQ